MSTIARIRPMATVLTTAAVLTVTACSTPTATGPTTTTPAQPSASPSATESTGAGALGAVPAGVGGAADSHPFPGQVDMGPAQQRANSDRNIWAVYDVRDGLHLRDGWFAATGKWSIADGGRGENRLGGDLPTRIDRYGWVSVDGWSPGFAYSHQIYDKANKPTGYWMGVKFASPATGSNSGSCDIYLGDPRQKGKWQPLSPYSCSWQNIRGWNPEPTLVLRSATLVTDTDKAADLLTDNCNGDDAADRCHYIGITSTTARGKLTPRGSEVINNGDSEATKKISWEYEQGTETSIGVEISNTFKLGEIWKLEVKASFEHKWEYKQKFGEDIEQHVDGRTVAWAKFAPNFVAFLGSWVVDAKDGTRYLLPDVSLKAPLEDGGLVEINTCPISEYLGKFTCKVVPDRVIVKP